ncbi:MAG TPA: 5-methyltetrahydropteroyltriglutamate--homocysteine S-methyltransferase [Burkholderiales bacterium]|nr:5-methyltetrahydropteroyltriglutamate--homocysteine S-methyltransferase [Burkholderiales bacterium]
MRRLRRAERAKLRPPFRADHVGSLLRPERLKAARERHLGPQTPTHALGPHRNEALRQVEDECIREAVAMQERLGLQAVTDGEFRRRSWWLELILGWEGFSADRTGSAKLKWRDASGPTQGFSDLNVVGPIRWRPGAIVAAFEFLKGQARATPKVTLPAPNCVHYYTGGKLGWYAKDPDRFWSDLVLAYRTEIAALVAAGARYIQLDDTSIAFICDPAHREYVRSWGMDPMALLELYAERINETIAGLPADVTVTLHQCRGNREGNWAAEGGYDPVADVLFNRIRVDGYFLEYDTPRAGGFAPLARLPRGGKRVALGLVSTKSPGLEGRDELLRRIEQAARFAPLGQLALSPQCGFASSIRGNPLGFADQEAKLARIVEVADQVWGNE